MVDHGFCTYIKEDNSIMSQRVKLLKQFTQAPLIAHDHYRVNSVTTALKTMVSCINLLVA